MYLFLKFLESITPIANISLRENVCGVRGPNWVSYFCLGCFLSVNLLSSSFSKSFQETWTRVILIELCAIWLNILVKRSKSPLKLALRPSKTGFFHNFFCSVEQLREISFLGKILTIVFNFFQQHAVSKFFQQLFNHHQFLIYLEFFWVSTQF